MPAPKNNLQEVLRRTAESGPGLSQISMKKSKFKPVPSAAPTSARKPILPSFSTPGFGRPNTHAYVTPRNREVISISTGSTPSSPPPRNIKRTSSDPSVASDPSPQPPKRIKHDLLAEKENVHRAPSKQPPAKSKSNPPLPPLPVPQIATNEEPWLDMALDPERNPFTKLVRDFPIDNPSSRKLGPDLPDQDTDLLSNDMETLKTLLLEDLELSGFITEQELAHHRSAVKKTDVALLQRLQSTVNQRIASIKKILAFREKEFPSLSSSIHVLTERTTLAAQPQPRKPVHPPVTSSASASQTQLEASLTAFTNSITREDASTSSSSTLHVNDPYDIEDDDEPMPGSDADYWAGMDEVPMEDTYHERQSEKLMLTSNQPSSNVTTPYHKEVMIKLRTVFGLRSFRRNQLEAITATLSGKDVFVLMPTGGGKSLCYQLPAVCKTGKTQGVTIVVSPLVSLMKDQVQSLQEKEVNVFLWNAEASWDEARHRIRASTKPDLIYITPEKLKESHTTQTVLDELYRNQQLARFVIDEAHCISTWGQDFREAYRDLDSLRAKYPSVPIMALTATATKVTVADVVKRLGLRDDFEFFTQSFNRPNLKYTIEPKTKNWMVSMMDFISSKHHKESGVIYCLGREKCEEVAKKLNEKGFNAKHFHAGVSAAEKDLTLEQWQKGKVHIIVATVAFGMGIDKADVRFVIHYCLPKSLDGYYQETGRAGRDGKPADCILYFLYKDFFAVRSMIERADRDNVAPTQDSINRQTAAARAVVDYCMNISVCRRVQILQYFDEKFDPAECRNNCDNCSHPDPLTSQDVTQEARNAVELVQSFEKRSELVTLAQCRDVLRGAKNVTVRNKQHDKEPLYGSAQHIASELLEQMLQKLCSKEVLREERLLQASGFHSEYLMLGPAAEEFLRTQQKIELKWRPKPGRAKSAKKPPVITSQSDSRAPQNRRKAAVEPDPIEMYDDDSYMSSEEKDIIISEEPPRSTKRTPPHLLEVKDLTNKLTDTRPEPARRNSDSASDLYRKMCHLRREVMVPLGISDPQEILDDGTLQYLSALCPGDYTTFKSHVKLMAEDYMTADDATAYAEKKFELYGAQFLALCTEHKCGPDARKATTFDAEGLRSRFVYQDHASSATRSVKPKFNAHR